MATVESIRAALCDGERHPYEDADEVVAVGDRGEIEARHEADEATLTIRFAPRLFGMGDDTHVYPEDL